MLFMWHSVAKKDITNPTQKSSKYKIPDKNLKIYGIEYHKLS